MPKISRLRRITKRHWGFAAVTVFALVFSLFLMFHTFSYDPQSDHLLIASTCWSDFGSHLPLIRSFTYGANLNRVLRLTPPEYPHFPGEPIRYHFLFYMIVGVLEKLGVRIDYAFNLPSAAGLALLIIMIYITAVKLFQSRVTGVLAVAFFLLNGSFSVLSYLSKHPFSPEFFRELVTVTRFPSFGPWDGGLVSAFWNLNIYTNQRHLPLSYGLALLAAFIALGMNGNNRQENLRKSAVIGAITGILLLLNQAAALISALVAGWIILLKRDIRLPAGAVVGGLPFLILYLTYIRASSAPVVDPGYLVPKPLTVPGMLTYWLYNFGLHLVLIPLGYILAPKKVRPLAVPLLALFIVPNIIRFSPDMINNHKFFNFFIIFGGMFSAWTVRTLIFAGRKLWQVIPSVTAAVVFIFCLTVSGVIDFLVIANDRKGGTPDVPANPDAQFFLNNTRPEDVILNSTWFYHPASLAGRSIFSGYPYFTWSYGYDKDGREEIARKIYEAQSVDDACTELRANHIDYVETSEKGEYIIINQNLWNESVINPRFINQESNKIYYETATVCR